MKLVNYKCNMCEKEDEHLFDDTTDAPELIGYCVCGGEIKKFNFKNNSQRWLYCDMEDCDE